MVDISKDIDFSDITDSRCNEVDGKSFPLTSYYEKAAKIVTDLT